MDRLLHNTLIPSNGSQLCVCYLVWIFLFIGTNIFWDIRSAATPAFRASDISGKSALLHPASSMCSCILVIAALINESLKDVSAESAVPIVIACLSGIFQAVGALCPYKSPV